MGYVDEIYRCVGQLGGDVAAALRPATQWRANAAALEGQLKALRGAGEAEHAAVIQAVAAGKMDLTAVPAKVAAAGVWSYDSAASKAVIAAIAGCHSSADAAQAAAGPAIFEACQRLVAGIVQESVRLVASLPPGVVDERSAFNASKGGLKHFDSWVRLGELYGMWGTVFELALAMERAGWVERQPPSRQRNMRGGPNGRAFTAYEKPHRLRDEFAGAPDERKLAIADAFGAGPGLYSWDAAGPRWHAAQRKYDAEGGFKHDATIMTQHGLIRA